MGFDLGFVTFNRTGGNPVLWTGQLSPVSILNDPKVFASFIFCGNSLHSLGPAYLIELLEVFIEYLILDSF